MRFLLLAMRYPTADGQSYLTTELADALVAGGHEVEVLHLDWEGQRRSGTEELMTATGVRVVRCSPTSISGLGAAVHGASKFLLGGIQSARIARRHFDLTRFDAVVGWMPALAFWPLGRMIERARIRHRLLFVWDFFPQHQHEIGRIPGRLPFRIARACEQRLLEKFSAVICTLPANADYLHRHFRIGREQRVLVTPIWGVAAPAGRVDRTAVRRRHGLPIEPPIAVFGGQMSEGRGFDQMVAAADAALAAGSDLLFLFVGDGRLAPAIRDRRQANLLYRPPLTRAEYVELLGACDVGMVATVPGVTSFSIPSKTIDYLRAGLPIIAAVEHGSEYADILARFDVGAAVPFGEPELFFKEALRLSRRERSGQAAARCLDEVFDVRHAVAKVLEATRASELEACA